VTLPGTADSSPIYLRGVAVRGAPHDVFVLTTSYGRAVAVDARSGEVLWQFTPPAYGSWAGTARITNSSPVADRGRGFVYSAAPDGRIHKLSLESGKEVTSGRWPAAVTLDPTHEKIGTPLNLHRGRILVGTGGYIGDAPPYQGHVAVVDAGTGRVLRVWNALCSGRHRLIEPRTCGESGAAIWARAGVVVDPTSGRLLVATGDGRFDGRGNWGDSVLVLSPDATRLVGNWTPRDHAQLDSGDVDLGSTAPALLSSRRAVQGGKDGKLRLLDLRRPNRTARAGARTGGELQTIPAPGEAGVFTAPAVWRSAGRTWLFVATGSRTAAYVLRGGRLRVAWRSGRGGTSPVVAGGLLYVYDPGGALVVYRARSGRRAAVLPAGSGHWSSPIVTDGRVALPRDARSPRRSLPRW
jgi:outer membrane protein assembly factor BamB